MSSNIKKMNATLNTVFGALVVIGLVMVMSSSMVVAERLASNSMYFFNKQITIMVFGLVLSFVVFQIPLKKLQSLGFPVFFICLILLTIVLIPAIGKEVNGSRRWINLGFTVIQVSEFVKLFFAIYLAGYIVRRQQEVTQKISGFIKPFILIFFLGGLLLLQPDFGSVVVLVITSLGMLWVAKAKIWHFVVSLSGISLLMFATAVTSPYRVKRLITFLDPWNDPFGQGYQLTQSLIAIGNGNWAGNGLGTSIQKYAYLPEAHTDFIFAIFAEELGLIGVFFLVILYMIVVAICFNIANNAFDNGLDFGGYLASGIGLWIGLQAIINMGVNLGMLPTKGITLPLVSYGGSSLLVMMICLGLLNRVSLETQNALKKTSTKRKQRANKEVMPNV